MEKNSILKTLINHSIIDKLAHLEKRNENEVTDLDHLLSTVKNLENTLKLCEKLNEEANKKLEDKMANSVLSTEPNREKSVGRALIKNATVTDVRQKSMPKQKSMVRNKTQLNITSESNRNGAVTKTPKPLARNATALNLNKTPIKTPSKANLHIDKGEKTLNRNLTSKNLSTNKDKDKKLSDKTDVKVNKMILETEEFKEKDLHHHKNENKASIKDDHKHAEPKAEPKHLIKEDHKQPETKAGPKAKDDIVEPVVKVETKIDVIEEIPIKEEKIDNFENNKPPADLVEFNEKDLVEFNEELKTSPKTNKFFDDNWTNLSKFFTSHDLLKVAQLNKHISNKALHELINILQVDLDKNAIRIKTLTDKYTSVDLNEKLPSPFILTRGATKAVELLNDSLYAKIFKEDTIPIDDIIMIYRLFFYLTNNSQVAELSESREFWSACCHQFNSIPNVMIGKYILDMIPNLNFSNENLFKMHKLLGNNSNKITPTHFSKLCGTTGLFLFLLKDAFEYCGILPDSKKTPPYNAYKFEKYYSEFVQSAIDKLNNILDRIKG